jgi:molybdopterin converting factor small subunit
MRQFLCAYFEPKGDKMKVEIFRLAGEPVTIEVSENGTVRDVFSHPDSGKAVRREGTLLEAAEYVYGSIENLGTLRVNGSAATLDTPVTAGSTILIIPKVEGGNM